MTPPRLDEAPLGVRVHIVAVCILLYPKLCCANKGDWAGRRKWHLQKRLSMNESVSTCSSRIETKDAFARRAAHGDCCRCRMRYQFGSWWFKGILCAFERGKKSKVAWKKKLIVRLNEGQDFDVLKILRDADLFVYFLREKIGILRSTKERPWGNQRSK